MDTSAEGMPQGGRGIFVCAATDLNFYHGGGIMCWFSLPSSPQKTIYRISKPDLNRKVCTFILQI